MKSKFGVENVNTKRTFFFFGKNRPKDNRYHVHVNVKKSNFDFSQVTRCVAHLGIVCIFIVAVTYFGIGIYKYLITDPQFNIRTISIENNITMTEQEILDASGVSKGQNIFMINLKYCTSQLLKFPNVKSVSIAKKLPDVLVIRIYEREAVAQLFNGRYFFLDDEGVVLSKMSHVPDPSLPVIEGIKVPVIDFGARLEIPDLMLALKAVKAYTESSLHDKLALRHFDISQPENIQIVTATESRIGLGKGDFPLHLFKLSKILDDLRRRNVVFSSIDLRFENVPVVLK